MKKILLALGLLPIFCVSPTFALTMALNLSELNSLQLFYGDSKDACFDNARRGSWPLVAGRDDTALAQSHHLTLSYTLYLCTKDGKYMSFDVKSSKKGLLGYHCDDASNITFNGLYASYERVNPRNYQGVSHCVYWFQNFNTY